MKVLIGGAASGKSTIAVRMATKWEGRVAVVATGEARDDEMAEKIRRHQRKRPQEWLTIEEPVDLEDALGRAPEDAMVLIDCLTLWVSNLIERGDSDEDIQKLAERAAVTAAGRSGTCIAVTNEVGSGIVPVNNLARRYRGLLGKVNTIWSQEADETLLVVAGKVLRLSDG